MSFWEIPGVCCTSCNLKSCIWSLKWQKRPFGLCLDRCTLSDALVNNFNTSIK